MGQSQLLDIAIGVVFVWFLFSVLLSVVNEAIALAFRVRAKQLWLAIGHLVDPVAARQGRKLLDTFIRLPFGPKGAGLELRPVATDESADRSYREADGQFDPQARAVSAQPDDANKALMRTLQLIYENAAPMLSDAAKAGRRSKLTRLPAEVFSEAVVASYQQLAVADLATFLDTNPKLQAAIRRAVEAAGIDRGITAARATIEDWYNREMDRLSAAYRRQNRKVLAVLAVPLVLILNANAIGTALELNHDSALRASLVNAAISTSEQSSLDAAIDQQCAPTTSTTSTTTAAEIATTDPYQAAVDRVNCAGKIVAAAQQFRLVPDLRHWGWSMVSRNWGLVGRLITLVALTFGAQFWFDVLRRLVGLRGALGGTPTRSSG